MTKYAFQENSDEEAEVGDAHPGDHDNHYFDECASFSEQKKQVVTTLTHLVMPHYYPEYVLIQEGLGE